MKSEMRIWKENAISYLRRSLAVKTSSLTYIQQVPSSDGRQAHRQQAQVKSWDLDTPIWSVRGQVTFHLSWVRVAGRYLSIPLSVDCLNPPGRLQTDTPADMSPESDCSLATCCHAKRATHWTGISEPAKPVPIHEFV
jgi:hypothetical protein